MVLGGLFNLSIGLLIREIRTIITFINSINLDHLPTMRSAEPCYWVDHLELLRNAVSGQSCSGPSLEEEGRSLYYSISLYFIGQCAATR